MLVLQADPKKRMIMKNAFDNESSREDKHSCEDII